VGAALAFRTDDAVKIDAIALKPEARRRGVGRKLVEEIEAEAIRLGAVAIYAGGATAENRGFYWRVGFRGRKSLMQKALPLGNRLTLERRRRASLERRSGF
jgi:ribosomal protein S18 acetylase RimI-like enzyme